MLDVIYIDWLWLKQRWGLRVVCSGNNLEWNTWLYEGLVQFIT